ncbi:hypothetical protein [Silvibacterium dinghuense]|nr:hypothetical protein [Silvibacterium dinghuense]
MFEEPELPVDVLGAGAGALLSDVEAEDSDDPAEVDDGPGFAEALLPA